MPKELRILLERIYEKIEAASVKLQLFKTAKKRRESDI